MAATEAFNFTFLGTKKNMVFIPEEQNIKNIFIFLQIIHSKLTKLQYELEGITLNNNNEWYDVLTILSLLQGGSPKVLTKPHPDELISCFLHDIKESCGNQLNAVFVCPYSCYTFMELLSNHHNPFTSWSDLTSSFRQSRDPGDLKHYPYNPNTLKLLMGDLYMKEKPTENIKTLYWKLNNNKQRTFKVTKTGVLYIAVVLDYQVIFLN